MSGKEPVPGVACPEREAPGAVAAYSRFLASAVARPDVPTRTRKRPRRTARDWTADVACFTYAVLTGLITLRGLTYDPRISDALLQADTLVGAAACAALWLRRRWPVGLAVLLVAASTVTPCTGNAMLMALLTVAAYRPFRVTAAVGVPALLTSPILCALRPPLPDPSLQALVELNLYNWGLTFAAIGWGMFVRSRGELVLSLRERARRAEVEASLRAEQARRMAREEVAREMHDVLAHRLSLLSMHAGALEFRPDAPPLTVGQAAGVIRESAHQALQELREVIGVLRAPAEGGAGGDRTRPSLAELPQLVAESQRTGMEVKLVDESKLAEAAVPERVGRTAYRVAQEGLTNARKHAPDTQTVITVTRGPGDGLALELRNPLPTQGNRRSVIPGSGQGLIGLKERAALAGGHLEHGLTASGDFRLYVWLPWPDTADAT